VPDKKRVLIVDDDGNLCQQLGKIIEFFGYEAVLAASNAEARQQIKNGVPDLVIADLHLPDGTGLDLMHELHLADPHLPVIILTGYPSQESIRRTMLEGGYTYLAKPVALDQLRQIIERAFQPRE
jgi:two-component system response regulator PilR (NtrC family)